MKPTGYSMATADQMDGAVLQEIRTLKQTRKWPLLLTGDVGTGKTCSAVCLYNAYQTLPMWHRSDDLLLAMSLGRNGGVQVETFNEYGELYRKAIPYSDFIGRVSRTCCLFLDDLGTRKPTEPMQQALFDLLEYRKGKAVCVTTNKTIPEIAELYDDRIADRFVAGTVIRFRGKSRRQRGNVLTVESGESQRGKA